MWFFQKLALDQSISGPIDNLIARSGWHETLKLSADSESKSDDTPLFETLTDDEILEAVKKDEDIDLSHVPDEGTSHSEAYSCATWMQQQKEFSTTQLMLMRNIRDVAAQKKLSSLKQKLITDFILFLF
ncbi:hypothetical protein T12_13397 [Trichinella patagoniensis]|uniref:Jerky-like protein-like n=1 Tax=Trichinella patagoniensis TaxID=990121 RepID=A0A0V0Z613_9BILA|nr:hypothetical protein T12_13397 [Trichinella patagoniensis]